MPDDTLVIRAARLIDGTARPPLDRPVVLVRNGQVVSVAQDEAGLPPDAHRLDFPDATLLPGLVDVHVHLNLPGDGTPPEDSMQESDAMLLLRSLRNAQLDLRAGATTVQDTGARNRTTLDLRDAIEAGVVEGPRLRVSGRPLTVTGGHMWYMQGEADGQDSVRRQVRQLVKERVDFVKVVATGGGTRGTDPFRTSYTPEEVHAAVDEAHQHGRLVAVHCLSTQGIVHALDAGADLLIHCYFYETDGVYRFRRDVAERIANSGARVNPTLHVARSRIWALERKSAAEGLSEPEQTRLDRERRDLEQRYEMFRQLRSLGVSLVAGSDAGWSQFPHGRFADEIEAMAAAGMSPAEALRAATGEAARALSLADQLGSIEPGKLADLLVVDGNPLEDLSALNRVRAVLRDGRPIEPHGGTHACA